MDTYFQIIFFISMFSLYHAYLGYVLLVFLMSMGKTLNSEPVIKVQAYISLLITARNEERVIKQKIENSLKLNYPKDQLEIMVISDGSTDRTDEIVRSFENRGVRLLKLEKQHGKTAAQNRGVEEASGEIIVFSDANAMYDSKAIQYLVRNFADSEVGCVSGELCYVNSKETLAGKEENLYWRYEKFIKKQENRAGSILGANGSIYAVRKKDYVVLAADIISDFIEPLEIAAAGRKVVLEPMALSFEQASDTFQDELTRKRRIISRSIHSLAIHKHLLSPVQFPWLCFGIISHKVLRWFSPIIMIILYFTNIFLIGKELFLTLFLIQSCFYLLALAGSFFKNIKSIPSIVMAPYYVCLVGIASIAGIVDWIKKKRNIYWEPSRIS